MNPHTNNLNAHTHQISKRTQKTNKYTTISVNEPENTLISLEDDTVITILTNCDSSDYDKYTFIESGSQTSGESLYNITTVFDSVHDITLSPLPAHDNLINLGLHSRGMHA